MIIAEVRARLAQPPERPQAGGFAEFVVGWLDPHGLWSAAPDAPTRAVITTEASALLDDLEGAPSDRTGCEAAVRIGASLEAWVERLRIPFEHSRKAAHAASAPTVHHLVTADVFEDDPVRTPAMVFAADLGRRVGAFELGVTPDGPRVASLTAERLLPTLSADGWSKVVLGAAVRAYVPLVDPHGEWSPLDEEWSLYAADALDDDPEEPRLWEHVARTAVGLRITDGAVEPLQDGDLVLDVAGVATAGLSIEQAEQLAPLEPVGEETVRVVHVLRGPNLTPIDANVEIPPVADDASDTGPELASERIRYGESEVLYVALADVPDSLGVRLARLVSDARASRPFQAVVLDLRGNGGGSTDGAAAAIGVFLPGAPTFTFVRRGGETETERAAAPQPAGQWLGPLAVLVDGYTASAAEMIAGALESYGRAVIVGTHTFGKGCIQEYFDDAAGAGILRLTTMLFSMPDGQALQKVGLTPNVELALAPVPDHEADLARALGPWHGPDVRDARRQMIARWPSPKGQIGPCRDPWVCNALRRLGSPVPRAQVAQRQAKAVALALRRSTKAPGP